MCVFILVYYTDSYLYTIILCMNILISSYFNFKVKGIIWILFLDLNFVCHFINLT